MQATDLSEDTYSWQMGKTWQGRENIRLTSYKIPFRPRPSVVLVPDLLIAQSSSRPYPSPPTRLRCFLDSEELDDDPWEDDDDFLEDEDAWDDEEEDC